MPTSDRMTDGELVAIAGRIAHGDGYADDPNVDELIARLTAELQRSRAAEPGDVAKGRPVCPFGDKRNECYCRACEQRRGWDAGHAAGSALLAATQQSFGRGLDLLNKLERLLRQGAVLGHVDTATGDSFWIERAAGDLFAEVRGLRARSVAVFRGPTLAAAIEAAPDPAAAKEGA